MSNRNEMLIALGVIGYLVWKSTGKPPPGVSGPDSPLSFAERIRYWSQRFEGEYGRLPSLSELLDYVRQHQSIAGPPAASVQFSKGPGGSVGCTVGLVPWGGVIGYGSDKADALHTAASIASDLHGVLNEHPELNAVLPPGTGLALDGIAAASKALKRGHTVDDVAKLVGPNTARVAARILSLF